MLHKSQLSRNLLSYFFFQVVELVYSSIFYKFLFFLIVVLLKCFCRNDIDSVYIGNCTWDGKRCLGKFVCLASWIAILFRRSAMRFNIRTWCSHCGKFHSHIFQIKTTAWRIFLVISIIPNIRYLNRISRSFFHVMTFQLTPEVWMSYAGWVRRRSVRRGVALKVIFKLIEAWSLCRP